MQPHSGIYFDGMSSKPQHVELRIDTDRGILTIVTEQGSKNWTPEDYTIEKINKQYTVRHKNNAELVTVDDQNIIKGLRLSDQESLGSKAYRKLINAGIKVHIILVLAILGFIVIFNQYVIPEAAERAAYLIPESYDNKLGSSFFNDYIEDQIIDSSRTVIVQEFANRLTLNNSKPLSFVIVDADIVNAFALPNGKVVIFSGIIDIMENYHELAALIGHEVAHVNERHSMRMLCRNISSYIFISAVLSDVNGIMAIIADNSHQLNSLSYSRDAEREADEIAFKILTQNNINPEGIVNLFEHLQEESDFNIPEFLTSHPVTEKRIEAVIQNINTMSFEIIEKQKLQSLFNQLK